MAAIANLSAGGDHNNSSSNNNNKNILEGLSNVSDTTTNGLAVPKSSVLGPTQLALRHNPGLSLKWTSEEHTILEDLLAKYSSGSNIVYYAKIALQLKDKTVRDVALRCRWIAEKENGQQRKDDHESARKNKDKKEKAMDSMPKSNVANRTNGPPYTQSVVSVDKDDGISYKAIGGETGKLLEQSARALEKISANLAASKIHENIDLFSQARNNILSVLNELKDIPEPMKRMPPLPVKLNEDLANSILPRASMPKKP